MRIAAKHRIYCVLIWEQIYLSYSHTLYLSDSLSLKQSIFSLSIYHALYTSDSLTLKQSIFRLYISHALCSLKLSNSQAVNLQAFYLSCSLCLRLCNSQAVSLSLMLSIFRLFISFTLKFGSLAGSSDLERASPSS